MTANSILLIKISLNKNIFILFFFTFSSNLNPVDKELIDAYKNNFNEIKYSIEKDIKDRDLESESNQIIYIQELEKINKELIENNIKLARIESDYDNAYKRDWSKDLKLILEQIAEFERNKSRENSPTDEILKYWAYNFYYQLDCDLHNMMKKSKWHKYQELSVQLDYLKKYKWFKELYHKIEELCSKVTEESIPKEFKVKCIDPIKRIFAYKSFTSEIERLKREIKIIEENKVKILFRSWEKYSLKWKYEDIAKDTKHLEEQIK